MFKKALALIVVVLLLALVAVNPAKGGGQETDERSLAKLKAKLVSLANRKAENVEVKLRDKTKLKGYISEINDEHFVVVDSSGGRHAVSYPRVKSVKAKGASNGARDAIFVGIVVSALVIPILLLGSVKE